MSFDPREYLQLAYAIGAQGQATDAALRCAFSRAYYACFLAARDRLLDMGWAGYQVQGCHALVKKQVKYRVTPAIYAKYDALLELRLHADYHCTATPSAINRNGNCPYCRRSTTAFPKPASSRDYWDELHAGLGPTGLQMVFDALTGMS